MSTVFVQDGNSIDYTPGADVALGDVVVESDLVAKPKNVRFAWHDSAEPNLANKEGLPASLFRTDKFRGVTADAK